MSGIISFLTGTLARMIWGELVTWWNARQDHRQEIERMRVSDELAQRAHERNMETLRFQADQAVKLVAAESEAKVVQLQVAGQVDLDKIDATTFGRVAESISNTTGFKTIDAWNAAIRAALATEVMILLFIMYYQKSFVFDDYFKELAGAVLGVYVGDRMLFRRGK